MRQTRLALVAFTALLLLPLAQAHGAPEPRSYESRLLHDCVDDWYGGDGNGLGGRSGYDLHSLDVREAWTQALGHHVIFRAVLNGEGQSTITLDLKADGTSRSYDWTGSGTTWTGTFDATRVDTTLQDGDRFALEGILKRSTLGVSVGDKLSDYTLVDTHGGDAQDQVPGDDSPALSSCDESELFARPDFTLRGPVQYIDADFEFASIEVAAGQEEFVVLNLENLLPDAAQTVTMQVTGAVQLHDPDTNQYTDTATRDLDKKRSGSQTHQGFMHVAIRGDEPASGTATVTLTTELGARITRSIDYEILPAGEEPEDPEPLPEPETEPGDEGAPGLPLVMLVGLLAFLARRR